MCYVKNKSGGGKTLVRNTRLDKSCFTKALLKPFQILVLNVTVLGRKKIHFSNLYVDHTFEAKRSKGPKTEC